MRIAPFLVPSFCLTVFLSAFLLFSSQPLIGKTLLPLLGGGPSVWNTAMLFFQILLLAGYAYAHLIGRFQNIKYQTIIHALFLISAATFLPLSLPYGADPTGQAPLMWQLKTMTIMIAVPFFVLASTAPLLQNWFSHTQHPNAKDPYFLYVASNIGSFTALISYPFIIEPLLTLHGQMQNWSYLYFVLAGLLLVCGFVPKFLNTDSKKSDEQIEKLSWSLRAKWLFLAFIPSSLMLGFTTYVTTDVTTVPLFWIIPLALYLLTFIIAFSTKPFFTLTTTRILQAIIALFLLWLMMSSGTMTKWLIAFVHAAFFFFTALLCHQELAALKPKTKYLTEFFLILSIGGALGGIFNSLLAPLIFLLPYEYIFVIVASMAARFMSSSTQGLRIDINYIKNLSLKDYNGNGTIWPITFIILFSALAMIPHTKGIDTFFAAGIVLILFRYIDYRGIFAGLFALVILMNPPIPWDYLTKSLVVERNYYGVIRVTDDKDLRIMTHGITNHGGQALDPAKRFTPYGYYSTTSGLADVFSTSHLKNSRAQNIAILGLGTGSMACFYNAPKRHFDYFEIDPAVIRIASDPTYFTYLSQCNIDYTMHTGDGRLLLSKQDNKKYDMIVMDAFTSDNIPVHVMTKNAVEIYRQKLKDSGVIVFHISNRFFVLQYELAAIARSFGKSVLYKIDKGDSRKKLTKDSNIVNYPNKYVVMTDNQTVKKELLAKGWTELSDPDFEPWTDDYANILRALPIFTLSR